MGIAIVVTSFYFNSMAGTKKNETQQYQYKIINIRVSDIQSVLVFPV